METLKSSKQKHLIIFILGGRDSSLAADANGKPMPAPTRRNPDPFYVDGQDAKFSGLVYIERVARRSPATHPVLT